MSTQIKWPNTMKSARRWLARKGISPDDTVHVFRLNRTIEEMTYLGLAETEHDTCVVVRSGDSDVLELVHYSRLRKAA